MQQALVVNNEVARLRDLIWQREQGGRSSDADMQPLAEDDAKSWIDVNASLVEPRALASLRKRDRVSKPRPRIVAHSARRITSIATLKKQLQCPCQKGKEASFSWAPCFFTEDGWNAIARERPSVLSPRLLPQHMLRQDNMLR